MNVFHMRETVRAGDDLRWAVLGSYAARDLRTEISQQRRDPAFLSDLTDVCRLDTQHAMALGEVRQQRSIIGPYVDHQIFRLQTNERARLAIQVREVLPQDSSGTAGVRITRRKQQPRRDRQTKL